MDILIIEPFYASSHKKWTDELIEHSSFQIEKLTLPGRHWKWRMQGAAVYLAEKFLKLKLNPKFILASDMLDLGTFLGLTRMKIGTTPIGIYFHENQLSYPWSPTDPDVKSGANYNYGFINYKSALCADVVFFNSLFHQNSFLSSLSQLLNRLPDFQSKNNVNLIRDKSKILPIGLTLKSLVLKPKPKNEVPILLWNHRWEYDKNPDLFFSTLMAIKKEDIAFKLIVLGENYQNSPAIFKTAKEELADRIIHWGYTSSITDYQNLLAKGDILPVTSIQDFFGISVVEAIAAGNIPILPNNLAYGPHIPSSLHEDLFYENEEGFKAALRSLIIQDRSSGTVSLLRDHILKYDWNNLIESYDKEFKALKLE